jgi:hypothetical protein
VVGPLRLGGDDGAGALQQPDVVPLPEGQEQGRLEPVRQRQVQRADVVALRPVPLLDGELEDADVQQRLAGTRLVVLLQELDHRRRPLEQQPLEARRAFGGAAGGGD